MAEFTPNLRPKFNNLCKNYPSQSENNLTLGIVLYVYSGQLSALVVVLFLFRKSILQISMKITNGNFKEKSLKLKV